MSAVPLHPDDILTNPGDAALQEAIQEVLRVTTPVPLDGALPPARRMRLEVTGGAHAGSELVSDKERVRIGAHRGNDLVLHADRAVSRFHCELQRSERGWLLVDVGSTNGTLLEGSQVERAWLAPGARLQVGHTTLRFTPLEAEQGEVALHGLVGASARMRHVFGLIRKIAPMDVSVVLQGETGAGKELAARAIHALSPRSHKPFVVLDCSAIPEHLIESELFGHERGAFTGAHTSRPGAFERAQGGTIFLDELGELRLDLQPKLLRVLESREVRRVGGTDTFRVDVRVVAATHRDLTQAVAAGLFREDLFFRLCVIQLQLPPLRERREDIPLILERALGEPVVVATHGHKRFSPEALSVLMGYEWPGNVRELMNVLSHVLTFAEGEEVLPEHLPPQLLGEGGGAELPCEARQSFRHAKEQLLEGFEREYLAALLRRCGGNLSQAARESGLHRKSIERLVKKYALDKPATPPKGRPSLAPGGRGPG